MSAAPGKTVLLTGATDGIGLAAALQLARRGHRLLLVGRDSRRLERTLSRVRRVARAPVETFRADFTDLSAVRRLADEVLSRVDRLDVLASNAGTVFPNRTLTRDGNEATFQVNHLAAYLLTRRLLPLLERAGTPQAPARVVLTASKAYLGGALDLDDLAYARDRYGTTKAYNRSKLCNVLFTRALARRLTGQGVTVNCLHPGAVATNIWTHAPWYARPLLELLKRTAMRSVSSGGARLAHLVDASAVEHLSGLYFERDQPQELSGPARDDALAEQLWTVSARLVGLPA